jgi:hypothetical protein
MSISAASSPDKPARRVRPSSLRPRRTRDGPSSRCPPCGVQIEHDRRYADADSTPREGVDRDRSRPDRLVDWGRPETALAYDGDGV